jgi:hypothetical protein
MRNFITSMSSLVLVVAAGCSDDNVSLQKQLVGQWGSPTCEAYPTAQGATTYLQRDFTLLASGTWSVQVTLAADPSCSQPFILLDLGGGPFHVGKSSTAVAGAYEVDYDFAYRKVTPMSAQAVALLDGSGCGASWAQDTEQDLSATGCAPLGLPSVAACPTEHDLNKLDGKSLFYGDRSGDLCTARPTMLTSFPVVRE